MRSQWRCRFYDDGEMNIAITFHFSYFPAWCDNSTDKSTWRLHAAHGIWHHMGLVVNEMVTVQWSKRGSMWVTRGPSELSFSSCFIGKQTSQMP